VVPRHAPFVKSKATWHGVGACSKWISDWELNAKKNDITDAMVTLNKLRYFEVTGEVKEPVGRVTLILQEINVGSRIIGWSWAD
jgi:hypothetical protein